MVMRKCSVGLIEYVSMSKRQLTELTRVTIQSGTRELINHTLNLVFLGLCSRSGLSAVEYIRGEARWNIC